MLLGREAQGPGSASAQIVAEAVAGTALAGGANAIVRDRRDFPHSRRSGRLCPRTAEKQKPASPLLSDRGRGGFRPPPADTRRQTSGYGRGSRGVDP
jgi:hypothetical protein